MENKNVEPQFDALLLNRLRIENKIKAAKTQIELDLMTALLYLYERGDVEISNDPYTGEMMYQATELN